MDYSKAGMFSSNSAQDTHVISRAVFDFIAAYIYIYITGLWCFAYLETSRRTDHQINYDVYVFISCLFIYLLLVILKEVSILKQILLLISSLFFLSFVYIFRLLYLKIASIQNFARDRLPFSRQVSLMLGLLHFRLQTRWLYSGISLRVDETKPRTTPQETSRLLLELEQFASPRSQ